MDIFSQGIFVILLPVLLIFVIVAGAIGLSSKQVRNTDELQDKINKLIEKIRKALFLDRIKK